MTQQEIINSNLSKTEKMKQLFELGLTRREVSNLMGIGYGFVQNVYARTYPDRVRTRTFREMVEEGVFTFNFNHKFGVEIEAFNITKSRLASALREAGIETNYENYNHNTRNYWKIVSDGSLTGNETFELVSPILEGENGLRELEKVCKVLKQENAKINKSCGLHIHFDATHFNLDTWKRIFKNYANLENNIDSFMPSSRRGNTAYYCRSMKVSNFENIIRQATTLKQMAELLTNRSRYYKVNAESYFRHKSIEFRQHSGSFEFKKISNWILFLARFVEFSKTSLIQNTTFEGMKTFLNDEIFNYLTQRRIELN